MSQVDLLLPQASLPVCEPSSLVCDSYVDTRVEPSGGEAANDDDKQSAAAEAGAAANQARKKRHRRGRTKKRKWRPYCKLTWDERREVEDREAKRAEKIRAHMCACGMALAPYNTTQFLMEDHNLQEPDYDHIPVARHRHHTGTDSSDEYYSSPEDEEDFLQQQFSETYKTFHAERLSNMSKNELVQELMNAEDRIEALEKTLERLRETQPDNKPPDVAEPNLHEQLEKIRVFNEEIAKLTRENESLRSENQDLRQQLHL